jgi:hypothetical protein
METECFDSNAVAGQAGVDFALKRRAQGFIDERTGDHDEKNQCTQTSG